VNDRRRRGFFRSMVSMMGILSRAATLMVDVRQTGGGHLTSLPVCAVGQRCALADTTMRPACAGRIGWDSAEERAVTQSCRSWGSRPLPG
jgi:hypothetical protein